jgi:hypothetical protein
MTADELQRLASILRWVGLVVTALGVVLTFGSHFIADKLFVAQRADKIQAQERLKVTEVELEQTKIKTAELAKRLAHRTLTTEQREQFIKFLSKTIKGPVVLEHSGQTVETIKFTEEISSLLIDAGFTIAAYNMPLGYVFKEAPEPWFITVITTAGKYPAYTEQLILAFKEIGIDVLLGNGAGIASPGEVKVYVGAK